MELDAKIEAILFFKGEPLTVKELTNLVGEDKSRVLHALSVLENRLREAGIRLVKNEEKVELRTAPEFSALIEDLKKEELAKDVGKAGAETLSIILYRGQVTRAEIDYIRGVNSTFILRNLLIRGLIERMINPKNARSFLYKPTLELLSFLGIKSVDDLPEYELAAKELKNFMESPIEGKNQK